MIGKRLEAAARQLIKEVTLLKVWDSAVAEGISPILLKGPAIARWLYDPPYLREYTDLDLMISPDQIGSFEDLLKRRGFIEPLPELSLNRPKTAHAWAHANGEIIDLHTSLAGLGVKPSMAWRVLSGRTTTLDIAGGCVTVLDEPARCLHLALHAWQDRGGVQSFSDLCLGLNRVPLQTWTEAASIALSLDAVPAFCEGLLRDPRGRLIVMESSLEPRFSIESRLAARENNPDVVAAAMGWVWLGTRPRVQDKTAYVLQKLFPSQEWMRARYPAARGSLSLIVRYFERWGRLLVVAARGLIAVLRSRREINNSSDRHAGSGN